MKAVVIGAGGFTGSYLLNAIGEKYTAVGTSTHNKKFMKIDLSEFNETLKALQKISPEVICLPAGVINLDYIEEHPAESRKINVLGTENVASYCRESNCRLVFFSSDAVFDGRNGPYSETYTPNPVCEYGRQKLEAENIVKNLRNFSIIRTSSIYGWDTRNLNFISRLVDNLKSNKELKVPVDQFYTPTYVVDLAKATLKLIEERCTGIFNLTGPDFMSRHEMALVACNVFRLKKDLIVPVKSSQLGQAAKRPEFGGLINKKAVEELGIKMRSVEEGFSDMLKNK